MHDAILQAFCDILSIITIATCFILKVPQIIRILKLQNAGGINIIGLLMELSSYTIMFSYNWRRGYALLSYMEYPIILAQQLLLIQCVLYYKGWYFTYTHLFGAVLYVCVLGSFVLHLAPLGIIAFLVPLCTPVGASSKVVQLIEILRTKDAESVSILTWFISAFTNLTRVFTIAMDSGDVSLLLNFIVNVLLSSAIMAVASYTKNAANKKKVQ